MLPRRVLLFKSVNALKDKIEDHKLLKSSNPSPSPRGPVLQFGHGSQPGPSFVGPMFSTGFRGRRGGRSGPLRGKCFYFKSAGHL